MKHPSKNARQIGALLLTAAMLAARLPATAAAPGDAMEYPITYDLTPNYEAWGWPVDDFPIDYKKYGLEFKDRGENPDTYTGKDTVTLKKANDAGTSLTFEGWYTDEDYQHRITEITVGTTGPITLYARPDLQNNYIFFNPLGGKYSGPNPYVSLGDQLVHLGTAERQGFEFVTWSEAVTTNADGERVADITDKGKTHDAGANLMPSQPFTQLYAAWKPAANQVKLHWLDPADSREIGHDYGVKGKTIADPGLSPARPGYTFDGKWYWDHALTRPWNLQSDTIPAPEDLAGDDFSLYAGLRENKAAETPSSGGGSDSGRDSSRSDRRDPPADRDRPSSNVDASGGVKSADAAQAVARAIASGEAPRADVKVKNAKFVSPETLRAMDGAAKAAGGTARLVADTVVNGAVTARITINAADAAKLPGDIRLGVSTREKDTRATRGLFGKYFENELAVLHMEHQGPIGTRVKVAVKVDIGFDLESARLYAYDRESNSYSLIEDPGMWMDKNGYLHFTTDRGGDIIVSNSELVKKKK